MHSICSLVCRNRHSGAGALVCCGASQLAVCSRKPESRPRRPLGQHPGSSVDAGASIRPGVHSHCTRVRYTHGRVHSHRTHVRYTHPNSVFDVYIGPVSDGRVPRCVYRACVRCPCTPQPLYMWVIYTSPPRSICCPTDCPTNLAQEAMPTWGTIWRMGAFS